MHDRRVARIITPGTLIDEQFMDPYANNYVMAIHLPGEKEQSDHELAASPDLHPDAVSPEAVSKASIPIGLSWLDLSTGLFFTHATTLSTLSSMLSRISPREVVLDEDLQTRTGHEVFSILAEDRHLITYAPPGQRELTTLADWAPMLESAIPRKNVAAFTDDEIKAGSLLLDYVKDRLQGTSMKLQPPMRHEAMQVMTIDKNGMRSLEIKQTIRDGTFRGSLLHAIRRTVTKSGARLLGEWLNAPSTSLEVIRLRQDLVACFVADESLRDSITLLLQRSHDSQRLVQKFALGRGDQDDLLDLASTIKATEDIVGLLTSAFSDDKAISTADKTCLSVMAERTVLDTPCKLARRIRAAIDEEGVSQQHQLDDDEANALAAIAAVAEGVTEASAEDDAAATTQPSSATITAATNKKQRQAAAAITPKPAASLRDYYGEDNGVWIMKPDASTHLKRLHNELATILAERDALAASLRTSLDAPSLTLKWTPGLGHIAVIKGRKELRSSAAALDSLALPQTGRATASSRSVHLPQWTELGRRLDQARFQIRGEEQRVFAELRQQTVKNIVKLRRNAVVLDELDVATAFARLAVEQNLVRPVLNSGTAHVVVGGRHPTVEGGLREAGRTFTGNDCFVGGSTTGDAAAREEHHGRVWLITGPNMAGKSTFLRQNALITILAQIGCYVPAAHAEIGIVDAMFSRVGSADNLYRDQSTFMVEMLETAEILRHATPRSFVIMDEIGRGTTPEDGAAVAFACLSHLVTVNRCRALFATHFHGVADLVARAGMRVQDGGEKGAVEMYCTDVEEDEQGGFVYVHRLRRGINRQSHALKVARLAGLPEAALRTAREVLVPQHVRGIETAAGSYDHSSRLSEQANG